MDEAKPKGDALDQLAKDAAAGAQFEFNPAAWDAMEQKLDAPKRGFFWWRLGGGLAMLLVVLFFIFKPFGESTETLDKNTSQDAENVTEQNDNRPSNSKNSDARNPQASGETDTTQEQDGLESTVENSNQSETKNTASTKTSTAITDQARTNTVTGSNKDAVSQKSVKAKDFTDDKLINSANNQNTTIANDVSGRAETTPQTNYFELPQPNATNDSMGEREADLYEASFETITPRWFPQKYLFDLSLKPMTLDSGNYRTPEVDSLQPFKRWSFGVLVSFDMSATGLDGFTKPGLMLGLQAEYNVSRNWSIQSGVSYSVKNYSALGTEYNTASWPGGRSDNLVAAIAKCFVIDIPFNLRRYIQGKNGNRWFVNTGVSTYLMLREDYDYEYTRPSPNWAPTAQIKGENNHVFGIANVSFGYETNLNKKFRLAVEPFMKLPLTGIGQGEVKFLSFGTNLIIKLK